MKRLKYFLSIMITVCLLLCAIAVTYLRFTLPKLNVYKDQIHAYVTEQTGVNFSMADISAYWGNRHPRIELTDLSIEKQKSFPVSASASFIQLEFDLLLSFFQFEPIVSGVIVDGLRMDIRALPLFEQTTSTELDNDQRKESRDLLKQIKLFLLGQFNHVSAEQAVIYYTSPSGVKAELNIEKLFWYNKGQQHLLDAKIFSGKEKKNHLIFKADFFDHGNLVDLSGHFYLSGNEVDILPWLPKDFLADSGVYEANVNVNAWVKVSRSHPVSAYLQINDSHLNWQAKKQHAIYFKSGEFLLEDTADGWLVKGINLDLETDRLIWPKMDISFGWQNGQSLVNISQIDLSLISPLVSLSSHDKFIQWFVHAKPRGQLEDIRLSYDKAQKNVNYSMYLKEVAVDNFELSPGIEWFDALIIGDSDGGSVTLQMDEQRIDYLSQFQSSWPLLSLYAHLQYQRLEKGWRFWSEQIDVKTQDLSFNGQFQLDWLEGQSPFLSLYGQTSVYFVENTWRYLPEKALGRYLTDYLSSALQGGVIHQAPILWYGALDQYPYLNHQGIFQSQVHLEQGIFQFDSQWPILTDLDLRLEFENNELRLEADKLTSLELTADTVTGGIKNFLDKPALSLSASVHGEGEAVRHYMQASPLIDSIGSTLNAIQVKGKVSSVFELFLPFDEHAASRVFGYADIHDSAIEIPSVQLEFEQASGRIHFDNDQIEARDFGALLFDQALSFSFDGKGADKRYDLDINFLANWQSAQFKDIFPVFSLVDFKGQLPWTLHIDVGVDDVGMDYKITGRADLTEVESNLPPPFQKIPGKNRFAFIKAKGNRQAADIQIDSPTLRYQGSLSLMEKVPLVTASELMVGAQKQSKSISTGQKISIKGNHIDLTPWAKRIAQFNDVDFGVHKPKLPPSKQMIEMLDDTALVHFAKPYIVDIQSDLLTFKSLRLTQVDFEASQQAKDWSFNVNGNELAGKGDYSVVDHSLALSLDKLTLDLPKRSQKLDQRMPFSSIESVNSKNAQSDIEHTGRIFHSLPSMMIEIENFWFEGVKLGQLNFDLARNQNSQHWQFVIKKEKEKTLDVSGHWILEAGESSTDAQFMLTGANNSELLKQLDLELGIKNASYQLTGQLKWLGSPWAMQTESLNGELDIELTDGVIENDNGATRFLGLISLDSLLRKLQFDFSGVFDKGLPFDSLTGKGVFKEGVLYSNNIEMDALAGDLELKGKINLNNNTIDAKAVFVPDLTSGLPVLTAFAASPPTALYVLAVTTLLSPVVEVFTQVNYEIIGPIASPNIKEISRKKAEIELPEDMLNEK